MGKTQTAALGILPPPPDFRFIDPLVVERTRFSPERTHRFTWFRYWGDPDSYLAVIGMNPSGADEAVGDSTVNKCCGYAKRWGFGAIYMLNAMSIRLTDSTSLVTAPSVNLPENDEWIRRIGSAAGMVLVAWGNPADKFQRGSQVEAILRESCDPAKVRCFGKNRNGSPVHALYQKNDAIPVSYF
jgi:hypothetical protein